MRDVCRYLFFSSCNFITSNLLFDAIVMLRKGYGKSVTHITHITHSPPYPQDKITMSNNRTRD